MQTTFLNHPATLRFYGGPGVEIIAHRGVRTLANPENIAPENTLAAFREANQGKYSVEMDVMATSDGVLVVHHDPLTGRIFKLAGGEKKITESPSSVLKTAQLNTKGHEAVVREILGGKQTYQMNPAFQKEGIPTLSSAVEALSDAPLYLELKTKTARASKNNDLEKRIVAFIQEKKLSHRVTLISFCQRSLRKIKALDPSLKTGWLFLQPAGFKRKFAKLYVNYAKYVLKADMILPTYSETTARLVEKAHAKGLKVVPWVRQETRPQEQKLFSPLRRWKVDGIITNAPDLLQQQLKTT